MRILARSFPITEIIFNALIIILVLTSYGYLFSVAFIIPIPSLTYNHYVRDVFQKFVSPDPVFPGANSLWCNTAEGMRGFVSVAERGSQCQISFHEFKLFCAVFGLKLSIGEIDILFNTLDITGNGMLSWGELSVDYFNTSIPAFIYYISRYKNQMHNKKDYASGLKRVEGFNYEPFRFDNSTQFGGQGIWGPLGNYVPPNA